MISIVLADDRALLRDALARLLSSLPGCRVTASGRAAELPGLLARARPDVIVLHASGGAGSARLIESVRAASDVPVVVVGSQPVNVLSAMARRSGAADHVCTDESTDRLFAAIERAAASVGSPGAGAGERDESTNLSEREFEVLCLIGAGLNGKATAQSLGISPKTVSTYRTRILEKLRLASTADIVRYALERGLVS